MELSTVVFLITLTLLVLAAAASYTSSKKDSKIAERLSLVLIVLILGLSVTKELLDWHEKQVAQGAQAEKDKQRDAAEKQKDIQRQKEVAAQQLANEQQQAAQAKAQQSLDSIGLHLDFANGRLRRTQSATSRVEQVVKTVYVPAPTPVPVGIASTPPAQVAVTTKRAKQPVDTDLLEALKEEAVESDMITSEIKRPSIGGGSCYGKYRIINKFSEPLVLYAIYSGGPKLYPEMLISPDAKEITPTIHAAQLDADGTCRSESISYDFYFRTMDSKKFGVVTLIPHVGKVRTKVIAPSNFLLAANGKRLN